MASDFKIGITAESLTSLDNLTTPCPDPQWEFREYRKMVRLGDFSMRGLGPQTPVWTFPLIEAEQIAQLEVYNTGDPIYIQTKKRDGTLHIFEVLFNWIDNRQDGDHMAGFPDYRSGHVIEMPVISEVIFS
jgi:hypothetical protein